jgi:thiol-activated cytolysin
MAKLKITTTKTKTAEVKDQNSLKLKFSKKETGDIKNAEKDVATFKNIEDMPIKKVIPKSDKKVVINKEDFASKKPISNRLGIERRNHTPVNFKFKIDKKSVLDSSTLTLSNGGKIKLEFGRNMVGSNSHKLNSKSDNSGNWTCNIRTHSKDVVDKDAVILNKQLDKIFVGGVYDIKNIANGQYNTLGHSRKPITIVCDKTKKAQVVVGSPSSGSIQTGIRELLASGKTGGSRTFGAKFEMHSEEDLFIKTGGSGNYLGFGGSHNFNYKSNEKSNKYVVEMVQAYYTVHVDSNVNEPGDFFYLKSESNKPDAIADSAIDPNWVYVDSVTYGRMLYVIYESDYSFSEFGIDVNMYAYFGVANGELDLTEKQKEMLKHTSVTIAAVGGEPVKAGFLTNTNSFKQLQKRIDDFLSEKNDEEKIAFSIATLDQATVGTRMITDYTTRQCTPRASKYRVTWESVENTINDDAGNASEIKAFVRIKAIGNGKSILDVDKKNKALTTWEDLPDKSKKIVPAPWTFTEGSSENPLELIQSGTWTVNKHLDFNIPLDDPNAKIGIRVDVREFDDFDDDQFAENAWQGKVSELSDKETVLLISRHEASRVTFKFIVEAIYEN